MDDRLRVTGTVALPRAELQWKFSRSGGPGGQSVNTADSKAELRFDLVNSTAIPEYLKARALDRLGDRLLDGVLVIVASEQRSQLQNRRAAEARLVNLLADALAPPAAPRRPTRIPRGAVQARLRNKKARADIKKGRRDKGE
ncbi:alternative ribosome rescue aminoacyl-tRNA hydrolase ArfB [Longispora sp. NPDC051575]|uniref:alternative ribosome rescue aminoacyl-tRNA hydrolase ArfB n=1 Tax=Longispora sp. NPDC051575 TaxID=3154943 RepID=UPI003429D9B7